VETQLVAGLAFALGQAQPQRERIAQPRAEARTRRRLPRRISQRRFELITGFHHALRSIGCVGRSFLVASPITKYYVKLSTPVTAVTSRFLRRDSREELTMMTRRATCSCGQLRVTCTGEPVRLSMCHCLECQK